MAHRFSNARTRGAAQAGLMSVAFAAGAATLGDIDVRSAPGHPLDAAIPVEAPTSEPLDPKCVSLVRGARADGPFVTRARVGIEVRGERQILRILGDEPIASPATRLRVLLRCRGAAPHGYREYTALFTRPVAAPLAPIAPPGVPGSSAAGAGPVASRGGFPILPGDTLRGISSAIFPTDAPARSAFVAALRRANPGLESVPEDAPLAIGSTIALPDLREVARLSFAGGGDSQAVPTLRAPAVAATPKPPSVRREEARAPAPGKSLLPPPPVQTASPAKVAETSTPRAPSPARMARPDAQPFVLRLSSPTIDLSRSRGISDRDRVRLRERLLLLEADDQVATLLALRESVRKLEGRVAELNLKVSGMPASMPAPAAATVPKPIPPASQPGPAPAAVPAKPTPVPAAKTPAAESPVPVEWIVAGVVLLAALAALIGLLRRNRSRRHSKPETTAADATVVVDAPTALRETDIADDTFDLTSEAPVAPDAGGRRFIGSDALLATEVRTGDPNTLRRKYIEERFPEIANRAIDLGNPESVVKGARLLYEDSLVPRAVELLHFATGQTPGAESIWLALFEIYRLERLKGEYAELMRRYVTEHGDSPNARKVRFFGRELDPEEPLYRDETPGMETIRFDAAKVAQVGRYDPVTENWLQAPMDFENEALASELRRALMAGAGIADADLAPNPMPALRSVEMFTVA